MLRLRHDLALLLEDLLALPVVDHGAFLLAHGPALLLLDRVVLSLALVLLNGLALLVVFGRAGLLQGRRALVLVLLYQLGGAPVLVLRLALLDVGHLALLLVGGGALPPVLLLADLLAFRLVEAEFPVGLGLPHQLAVLPVVASPVVVF